MDSIVFYDPPATLTPDIQTELGNACKPGSKSKKDVLDALNKIAPDLKSLPYLSKSKTTKGQISREELCDEISSMLSKSRPHPSFKNDGTYYDQDELRKTICPKVVPLSSGSLKDQNCNTNTKKNPEGLSKEELYKKLQQLIRGSASSSSTASVPAPDTSVTEPELPVSVPSSAAAGAPVESVGDEHKEIEFRHLDSILVGPFHTTHINWYTEAEPDVATLREKHTPNLFDLLERYNEEISAPRSEYHVNFGFRMESPIDSEQFELYKIKGDGDCLFHCFAGHLNVIGHEGRSNWTQQEIRNTLASLYEQWPERFFVNEERSVKTKADYITYINTSGNWGGNIDIQAFSIKFGINCKFFIQLANGSIETQTFTYDTSVTDPTTLESFAVIGRVQNIPPNKIEPLYLLANGVHYDILIEKPMGQIPDIGGGIPSTVSLTYNPFPYMNETFIKHQISIKKAVYMANIFAARESSRQEIQPSRAGGMVNPPRAGHVSEEQEQPRRAFEPDTSIGTIPSVVFQPGRFIPNDTRRNEMLRRIVQCLM